MGKDEKVKVPCETYSRVAGYFRPVAQWNGGKQSEFSERKLYDANDKLRIVFNKVEV